MVKEGNLDGFLMHGSTKENYHCDERIDRIASYNGSFVLVIHGGAGTMERQHSTPEQRAAYRQALAQALNAGHDVLKHGGEAMDAAVAAVTVMEDNPLFNAGKGAVFTTAGKNELESSIMLSKPPASSAVAIPHSRRGASLTLLTRVKNPAKLARAIYLNPSLAVPGLGPGPDAQAQRTIDIPHAFLSGSEAESIAQHLNEELVDPSYFFTERRWKDHRQGLGLPDEEMAASGKTDADLPPQGTVGAVALDIRGCISAVTSTGGRTNKLPGRIGDTPIMGAGFWAEEWVQEQDNKGWISAVLSMIGLQKPGNDVKEKRRAVGISGTGDGDYFIRQCTTSSIAHRMKLLGESAEEASQRVVKDLYDLGGLGGVIVLDREGNVSMPLNCSGMYRGLIREDGIAKVAIFDDDVLEEQPS